MSTLNNITIVIPTYKRYPFLKRLLKFYNDFAIPIKILILDSTPYEPSDTELEQLLFTDGTIWKKFDPEITYWDRVSRGTEFIDTDYVTLCADDDFIIPGAITQCIKFLDNNPEYSSAHGLYFIHSNIEEIKRNNFSIGPLYHKGRSALEETGSERVQSYLRGKTHYYPLYAIQKTETFRTIWLETEKYTSDWYLTELFPCCLSFIYGKMKILPIFYASREPNTYDVNNYEIFKRCFSKNKLNKAVEGVTNHLSKADRIPIQEAESIVRGLFNEYVNSAKENYQSNSYTQSNNGIAIWNKWKQKVKIRRKLRSIFMQGCHSSIYPDYLEDYINVKKAVLSAKLTSDELNKSRQDFANQEG